MRMGVSSRAYEAYRTVAARSGVKLNRLTRAEADLVDRCEFRVAARAKRKPVARRDADASKPKKGEVCQIDHQPHDVASPIDGARGQLNAVDERTDFTYAKNVKHHTVSDVVTFVKEYAAYLAKFGRKLKFCRFDRAPELATPQLKAALAAVGIACEVAPRGHVMRASLVSKRSRILSIASPTPC